jgi:hypothetical protein
MVICCVHTTLAVPSLFVQLNHGSHKPQQAVKLCSRGTVTAACGAPDKSAPCSLYATGSAMLAGAVSSLHCQLAL